MVGCVYNKTANGACSRDRYRTTTISEMDFSVTIINRDALKIFTSIVNFKFQFLFNNLWKVLQTDCLHVNTNFVRCLQQFLNLSTSAYGRFSYVGISVLPASYEDS